MTYENIENTGKNYSWYSQSKGFEVIYEDENVDYLILHITQGLSALLFLTMNFFTFMKQTRFLIYQRL